MSDDVQRMAFPAGELVLRVSAATDRGLVRAVNEDAVLAEAPVFAVAGGMGGHAAGDRASAAAVAALRAVIRAGRPATPDTVREAVHRANADVRAIGDEVRVAASAGDPAAVGAGGIAGTTLAAVVVVDPGAWMIVHLGDSRVYGWDGGALARLTVDHSLVQEMVDARAIDAAEAERHPARNVVTRALGAQDAALPDVRMLDLGLPGEHTALLVCSDGLTRELDDAAIGRLLVGGADADALVAAALAAGGRDNVSAIVVRPELTGPSWLSCQDVQE